MCLTEIQSLPKPKYSYIFKEKTGLIWKPLNTNLGHEECNCADSSEILGKA